MWKPHKLFYFKIYITSKDFVIRHGTVCVAFYMNGSKMAYSSPFYISSILFSYNLQDDTSISYVNMYSVGFHILDSLFLPQTKPSSEITITRDKKIVFYFSAIFRKYLNVKF